MQTNKLIAKLSERCQILILDSAKLEILNTSELICRANEITQFVWFPIDGYISNIEVVDKNKEIEVGMIGEEGLLGAEVAIGLAKNPYTAIVQGQGRAWKISTSDILFLIKKESEIQAMIFGYLGFRFRQIGMSLGCSHYHGIQQRLAKWILMSQDRAKSSTIAMTQKFISVMLGVRRVSVSGVAKEYGQLGLIEYKRGSIKILDRDKLLRLTCDCYQRELELYKCCQISHINNEGDVNDGV